MLRNTILLFMCLISNIVFASTNSSNWWLNWSLGIQETQVESTSIISNSYSDGGPLNYFALGRQHNQISYGLRHVQYIGLDFTDIIDCIFSSCENNLNIQENSFIVARAFQQGKILLATGLGYITLDQNDVKAFEGLAIPMEATWIAFQTQYIGLTTKLVANLNEKSHAIGLAFGFNVYF